MQSKKFLVVGTAGHIDHGKTSLIRTLTGVDTDRWEEEKRRGMTIDLGFAHLELPNGTLAGIVDVPGHEKFIKNMLAGAHGLDLVLFVIAADEGVMPQTEEHLTVCQTLGTKRGIVVLTKKDLVDEEWLELVKEEVRDFVKGTFLEGAPIVSVSSKTGEGIDELLEELSKVSSQVKPKSSEGLLRLPVDRSFTVKGFGTVVTGTLLSGKLEVGEEVEILPEGIKSKVRGIQVHGKPVDRAFAGQRTAVNLAGVSKEEVKRGNLISAPGYLKPTKLVDVVLEVSRSADVVVESGFKVHFHHLTSETEGEVYLINKEELLPGEKALAQIRLRDEVVPVYGDRFIVRNYSPARVIGGGWIVNPLPEKKFRRRFRDRWISFLTPLTEREKVEGKLIYLVGKFPGKFSYGDFVQRLALSPREAKELTERLLLEGKINEFNRKLYPPTFKEELKGKILEEIERYHETYPVSEGINRESLRTNLNIPQELLERVISELSREGKIEEVGSQLKLKGFKPEPKEEFSEIADILRKYSKKSLFSPPSLKEISKETGTSETKVYMTADYLVKNEGFHKIGNFLFSPDAFRKIVKILKEHFLREETLSVSEFKDYLGVSRKFAIPILEYLDSLQLTERKGNERIRGRAL
ncbi:MAG: selenocysteine-specific translation elongation factor [Thermovibrio sp.]|nr:MAG: selenocysteine-specific translation elongation factor [Thermovibrio sp.]